MTTNTTVHVGSSALADQDGRHRCNAGWLRPLPDGTAVPCLVCKPHLRPDEGLSRGDADDAEPLRRDRDGDLVPADAPAAAELIRARLREQYARPLAPAAAHTDTCRTCGQPLTDADQSRPSTDTTSSQ